MMRKGLSEAFYFTIISSLNATEIHSKSIGHPCDAVL
jgi:hypothetical protein